MTTRAEMTARHSAALMELAELGMSLASNLQARMLTADSKSIGDLSRAFEHVSRSVGETMAFKARLERESRLAPRDGAHAAARAKLVRVQKKRAQLRDAVAPLVWTEAENDEKKREALLERVKALVFKLSRDDGFLNMPVDACVARIRVDLGLAAASLVESDEAPPASVQRSSS